MKLDINSFFETPSEIEWKEAVSKTLRLTTPEQTEEYLEKLNIEGLVNRCYPEQVKEDIYLNSFPTERILGREILVGQEYLEDLEVGINYVFSQQPVTLNKNQKLIQTLSHKENKVFGDEVLLDIFSLLQEFEYSIDDLSEFVQKMMKEKHTHFLFDSTDLHNAGASMGIEISHVLFLALKFSDIAHQNNRKICFKLPADSSYFCQIAKLRALRYLYETILEKEELNIDNFLIISAGSMREMTLYDPWVNMLRATTNICSSFLGGADVIIPQSFDYLNQVYTTGGCSTLGLRQSRNIFHILKEESQLDFVNDPGRGAFAIEDLTVQLIEQSFNKLKEIKKQKSLKFLYEKLADEVKAKSNERIDQVKNRIRTICGINNYSKADESLLTHFKPKDILPKDVLFPIRRLATEFEVLRLEYEAALKKEDKKILILYFGDLKQINARISFCKNYFEILGAKIETFEIKDKMTFNEKEYAATVYCAADDDYEELLNMTEPSYNVQLFLAGDKYQRTGFTNLHQKQNVFDILSEFVMKENLS